MASGRRKPREDRFYRRGRVATEPRDIEEAAGRRRGQLRVTGVSGRGYNWLDAAHTGQEDYRAGKPAASGELFARRARNAAGLRRLALAEDDLAGLYAAYVGGHSGELLEEAA